MHLEDKKKSFLLFWTVFFTYILVYMTKNCFFAAMASIVDVGVLTKSQTGLVTALFYLVYTPLQVVGGIFADRFKPALLIKIGLIGGAIANTVIFFNQQYLVILLAWVFNAVIQFGVWPGIFKILSFQLVPEHRSQAAFFISFSSTLGLMIAYIIAAVVNRWQENFLISSVVLFVLTVVFHFITKYIEPHMVAAPSVCGVHTDEPLVIAQPRLSSGKLLLLGGVGFVAVYIIFRAAVENGLKTLSATMLMEAYEHVSPTIGNLLNTLVILSGVVGTVVVRFILSRFIKDEIVATVLLLLFCLPFTLILCFVGDCPIWLVVASLCVVVAALNATHYLSLAYNIRFARYGLSATAAGITNAAASMGVVIQSYGFTLLAETTGWNVVAYVWLAMLGASAVLLMIALPTWKRFVAIERQEEGV